MRLTKFSIGRRWRCVRARSGAREPFDFVILGPPVHVWGKPSTQRQYKSCRLEMHGHTKKHSPLCSHGNVQDYSHAHLQRVAVLVEDDDAARKLAGIEGT